MKIDCQECGTRILAEDLDLPTSMAKCRNCNAVFSFADRLAAPPPPQPERLRAPRPEGLQVHETSVAPSEPGYRDAARRQGSISVVRRGFSHIFIILALF